MTGPAVADGTVYVGWQASAGAGLGATETGGVEAVSVDGDREWRIDPGAVRGPPAVVDGVVYAGTPAAAHAFDAAGGEELWRFEPTGNTGSPTVADGLAFLGSLSSRFYAVDAATGERRWVRSLENPLSDPVVADGTVTSLPRTPSSRSANWHRCARAGGDAGPGRPAVRRGSIGSPGGAGDDGVTVRGAEPAGRHAASLDGCGPKPRRQRTRIGRGLREGNDRPAEHPCRAQRGAIPGDERVAASEPP